MVCFIAACAFMATTLSLAKSLNLYDQPKVDAKVIATIDSTVGMVPIFTPKDGDWIKVGDPKNGNVGWVKTSDFSNDSDLGSQLTVTEQTIRTSEGPKTYRIIQFGTPSTLTAEQASAMTKEAQQRQQAIQESVQKMMQNFYNDMNDLYRTNASVLGNTLTNFPMVMPIIILPQANTSDTTPVTPTTKPTTTSSITPAKTTK